MKIIQGSLNILHKIHQKYPNDPKYSDKQVGHLVQTQIRLIRVFTVCSSLKKLGWGGGGNFE